MDKNQAMIDFLIQCPDIENSPLFFNFINAKEDNKQIITLQNEKILDKPFINGDVQKRYTCTLVDFKSVAYNAIVKQEGYQDENVEDMQSVQEIIDWISEQNDERNFPDFGENCIIEAIRVLTDNPNLNGIDSNASPALAKYSLSIQIDYLDTSKRIWN